MSPPCYSYTSSKKIDAAGATAAADPVELPVETFAPSAVPSKGTTKVSAKPELNKKQKANKSALQECPICMDMCPDVQRLKVRLISSFVYARLALVPDSKVIPQQFSDEYCDIHYQHANDSKMSVSVKAATASHKACAACRKQMVLSLYFLRVCKVIAVPETTNVRFRLVAIRSAPGVAKMWFGVRYLGF